MYFLAGVTTCNFYLHSWKRSKEDLNKKIEVNGGGDLVGFLTCPMLCMARL